MPSGGARARSGPPPDPDALRRARPSDQAGWETLPGPREGDPPEWPAAVGEPSVAELAQWADEWKRPQARKWEERDQATTAAAYVRVYLRCMDPKAPAALVNAMIRLQEDLGISNAGLARNRWRIGPSEQQEAEKRGRAAARARDRGLTVVKGGGEAA